MSEQEQKDSIGRIEIAPEVLTTIAHYTTLLCRALRERHEADDRHASHVAIGALEHGLAVQLDMVPSAVLVPDDLDIGSGDRPPTSPLR